MSDSSVQLAPDGTGKRVDTSELLVGANLVQRQRVVIGDDASADGLAKVSASDPASSDPALVVRDVLGPELRDLAEAVAFLASCIHDRLPISDAQKRMRVYLEGSNGGYAGLALVGVANPVNNQVMHLQHAPYNFMAMDAARLYQHIQVT